MIIPNIWKNVQNHQPVLHPMRITLISRLLNRKTTCHFPSPFFGYSPLNYAAPSPITPWLPTEPERGCDLDIPMAPTLGAHEYLIWSGEEIILMVSCLLGIAILGTRSKFQIRAHDFAIKKGIEPQKMRALPATVPSTIWCKFIQAAFPPIHLTYPQPQWNFNI